MADLELRHLRYLIAVAETGSITRAAQRLLMTQPALSRAIRQLERAAGVELFERSTRSTLLTPAGAELLTQAYEIVELSDSALSRARRARRGHETLRVTTHECDIVEAVAAGRAFERDHDGVRVEIRARDWETQPQPDELRAGKADVSFLRDNFDRRDLLVDTLARERRSVVLPLDHPLATRERLTVHDLRDETFTYWAGMSAEEGAFFSGSDTGHGPRRTGPRVRNSAEALAAILLGHAIGFAHDTTLQHAHVPGMLVRPVEGISDSRLDVAISAHGANPTAKLFADYARARWAAAA